MLKRRNSTYTSSQCRCILSDLTLEFRSCFSNLFGNFIPIYIDNTGLICCGDQDN